MWKLKRSFSTFNLDVADALKKAEIGFYQKFYTASPQDQLKMSMLLLHPPGACSAFTRSGSQYPPLGLNQLKALISCPTRVDVLEADGYSLSVEETAARISSISAKAIGMTVTCGTKKLVHTWSTISKNLSPEYNPLIFVGGPATAFESSSIFRDCPNVDVIVKGEGEVTFPTIISILENSTSDRTEVLDELAKLPGVCVRNKPTMNDMKIPTLPKETFKELPFPDLSASPVSKYKAPDAKRLPMVTMMTQRGCIASCTFCNTPQIHGKKIRGWSNEQIIEELIHLRSTHGIKEVSFVDDVFTNRPGGPRKLCELMIEKKLDLTWYCNARADQITKRMAEAMKNAGCHQVFLGFESGCDEMLLRIRKGEKVKDLERGASILKEAGIFISIGFIIGLPGETQHSVNKTIELCNRVKPNRVQFTRFTPIPGSSIAVQYNLNEGKGFHDRSAKDEIETWIKQCYDNCTYKPSL